MKALSGPGVIPAMCTFREEFDDHEHVVGHEPAERGDLDGEEVGGRDAFPMGGQKRAPRRPLTSLGRGLYAVLS